MYNSYYFESACNDDMAVSSPTSETLFTAVKRLNTRHCHVTQLYASKTLPHRGKFMRLLSAVEVIIYNTLAN